MRHNGMVSGYTISTGFCGLMGDQQTPGFWGVTVEYQSIVMRLPSA